MQTTTYHVIIADDQPGVRGLIARVVARTYPAVTITAVADGLEALRVFERHGADLLITNYNMPGLNGLQLAQHLRAQATTLPIVMVSASAGMAGHALAAGVTSFVAKPFTITELAQTLRDLLQP